MGLWHALLLECLLASVAVVSLSSNSLLQRCFSRSSRTFHPQPVHVQHPVHRAQCALNAARALQEPETFRGLALPCSELYGHFLDYKPYAEHGCPWCGPVGGRCISAYRLKQYETQARGRDAGICVGALSSVVHGARAFLVDRRVHLQRMETGFAVFSMVFHCASLALTLLVLCVTFSQSNSKGGIKSNYASLALRTYTALRPSLEVPT